MSTLQHILYVCLIFLISCTKLSEENLSDNTEFLNARGLFVINEGNFMAGNGSLSFYSKDSSKIYNDIFLKANNRPLGDVPNSMILFQGKVFIVVNNSGKIEVSWSNSMKSVATITSLVSPRHMLVVNNTKAYVSSLYSTKLTIINPSDFTITGYLEIYRSSETMIYYGGKAYIACWSRGEEIIVINALNDTIIDSIKVGHEPESMAIDKYGRLWVLCSGSYTEEYYPELVVINTSSQTVEKKFQFDLKMMYPSCLRINKSADTIYYIEKSVWRMAVDSEKLPAVPFIKSSGRLFYKMSIDPDDGKLYVTNAVDYQQKGYLLVFRRDGTIADSVKTGIIPGYICFKN